MSMSYTLLNKKFSEECVGLCEEMGLQPISELFTTDGGWAQMCRERVPDNINQTLNQTLSCDLRRECHFVLYNFVCR